MTAPVPELRRLAAAGKDFAEMVGHRDGSGIVPVLVDDLVAVLDAAEALAAVPEFPVNAYVAWMKTGSTKDADRLQEWQDRHEAALARWRELTGETDG